ncbi:MAG: hypothetical protein HFG37_08870 [Eubacterium sp.]|nr:hypothetical protein [Eubacterium sp.]MCI9412495.1 hypothetical protein [Eubacterium sp.]
MDTILVTVKDVAIFVLVFSIISNLFSGSSYHRYFRFVEGLMILILVMTPLFAWFTSENFLDDCLDGHIFELENGFQEDELRMIGEERDELLKEGTQAGAGEEEYRETR